MENRCIYCNEIIPEGRQICPICEEKERSAPRYTKSEFKQIIWAYIRKHGILVTNQNIDWLLQEAIKEWEDEKIKK